MKLGGRSRYVHDLVLEAFVGPCSPGLECCHGPGGKLDRLLGDFGLLVALRDAKVKFIAADDPHATDLTVDIRCAIAAEEVRKISARTREGLASLKARGVTLGKPDNFTAEGRAAGGETNKLKAIERDAGSYVALKALAQQGLTLREIAARMERNPMWVSRALKRFGLQRG